MKPPLTYYGGKQKLAKTIIKLIPAHTAYVEPFFGGGAVFFAKEPAKIEIINDINDTIVNFYHVCKTQFPELQKRIAYTLHARAEYNKAAEILKDSTDTYTPVERAWAVWVQSNTSFCRKILHGFRVSAKQNLAKETANRISRFTDSICQMLQNTQIECRDALKIIQFYDTPDTFFYLDPPYPDTEQAFYKGYSADDFKNLLETLTHIKGKFLLSSFQYDYLDTYTAKNGWQQIAIQMNKDMTNISTQAKKIEVLTANYLIGSIQNVLYRCGSAHVKARQSQPAGQRLNNHA